MGKSQLGFLNHPDPDYRKGCSYGFYEQDKWTEEELDAIRITLDECIGEVSRGYNAWMFSKFQYGDESPQYSVGRYTWQYGHWHSSVLGELLDMIWLDSIRVISAIPIDAQYITIGELAKPSLAWYLDMWEDIDTNRRFTSMHAIWLIDRPHVRGIIYTYDDNPSTTSQCWTSLRYIQPIDRTT